MNIVRNWIKQKLYQIPSHGKLGGLEAGKSRFTSKSISMEKLTSLVFEIRECMLLSGASDAVKMYLPLGAPVASC